MLEQLLARDEGKTLEFKENSKPIQGIVQTAIAFANTAGGIILLGIKDGTKEVVGLDNILEDELKIANAIAASVSPLLIPSFQFSTWRHRDILIITIPHSFGPYFLSSKGEEEGTFIRLGSTNRLADMRILAEIKRFKERIAFDQLPDCKHSLEDLDFELAKRLFDHTGKAFSKGTAKSFELLTEHQSKLYPSKGGLLLFGKNREDLFPDPLIRLARFEGINKTRVLDHLDLRSPLSVALDEILTFIRRNTSLGAVIKDIRRQDIPEYSPLVIREAVLNALAHADYSAMESPIHIAIFDNRLEITNPGSMPLGMSLEIALSGVSQLRNRVLGRVFRELRLTDQWGSGLNRMIDACLQNHIKPPKFEELGQFFRVTLYPRSTLPSPSVHWHILIMEYLGRHESITAKIAQELWEISRRTATNRLKSMCEQGILVEISTGPRDPYKTFILAKHRN
jgi:predicted HTH transcriptional regulator